MIFFFLPQQDIPTFSDLPNEHDIIRYPKLFLAPSLNWTWRTYYHLSSIGYPCQLVTSLPSKGIIFSAACNLPILFRPNPEQFIISCVADSPPLFFAQCQIFQSNRQALQWQELSPLFYVDYMPHWGQPGLVPRAIDRANDLKNLDYFGAKDQIDQSLLTQKVYGQFEKIGLSLRFNFQNFHNYREADCAFAVRNFSENLISHKPASKLINAWRAGTPAILGKEAAFREQVRSKLDYFEVNSIEEMFNACMLLKEDKKLFSSMVENGFSRAEEFSDDSLTQKWIDILDKKILVAYEKWINMDWLSRQKYYAEQLVYRVEQSLRRRFQKIAEI